MEFIKKSKNFEKSIFKVKWKKFFWILIFWKMITKVNSIAVNWLNTDLIEVEVDINQGLPSFTIVWLPDQWVQESKERLRSALKSSSAKVPASKITVNLAPADIRKSWPSFDFPIAIGILDYDFNFKKEILQESIFLWELSLNWDLRKINSVLPATIWAKEKWFKNIFIPEENSFEASVIPWINVVPIKNLREIIDILLWNKEIKTTEKLDLLSLEKNFWENKYDFKYVIWQSMAKRALEIAASWGHNIIMNWPPGSWKTMLAKAFSTILPNLTIDESIEISKIYSISWLLSAENPLIVKRPFRIVHHTASSISIIWWWRTAKPGEISLAHKWVLFLDEILEFQKSVLEVLRQPLEDWEITVNRVNASFTYPAKFILVWAMNPCPCGFLTDPDKDCICSPNQVKNYSSKLSWPLIDRVDIFIEVPKVKTEEFSMKKDKKLAESSEDIKQRVEKAREIQLKRFAWTKITFNSEMSTKEINKFCELDLETENILKQAVIMMNLSARSYYRILKLSRTIADLANSEKILKEHILEALSFRKSGE